MAVVAQVLARLRREPLSSSLLDDLPIAGCVDQLCGECEHGWRDRVLTPLVTLRLFLLQVLHGNTSIAHLRQLSGLAFAPASYCEARRRTFKYVTANLAAGGAYEGFRVATPAEAATLLFHAGLFSSPNQWSTGFNTQAAYDLYLGFLQQWGCNKSEVVFSRKYDSSRFWVDHYAGAGYDGQGMHYMGGINTTDDWYHTPRSWSGGASTDWSTWIDDTNHDSSLSTALVRATPALPGDADGDGDMDLDDQGIWAANFTGSLAPNTGIANFSMGDFDGDKDVDLDDQGIWAANFTGSLAPSPLVSVPEPAPMAACALAVFPLIRRRPIV